MLPYPPFGVRVATPRLELRAATDDLLEHLVPLVRSGKATADPPPWDDPSAFYEPDPDRRVDHWLRSIWRGRGTVKPELWRLYFVVVADVEPVGMQSLIGDHVASYRAVETSSWVSSDARGRGIGTEMRSAALHLAFAGFEAREAHSEAAVDNAGSNAVSERLGHERHGQSWATHQGRPVLGQRWLLRRRAWEARRRDDITLHGVEECRAALDIRQEAPASAEGRHAVRAGARCPNPTDDRGVRAPADPGR